MIRNYIITAIRSLLRHRTFSIINLLGLTVGLSTTLFILLWIRDELTYDRFHKDIDQLYVVMEHQTYSHDQIYTFMATPGKLAEALQSEFPEVEMAVRSNWGGRELFQFGEKFFFGEGRFADSLLMKMFTFEWVEGDPENPVPDQTSVVISVSFAEKLFGRDIALGKMVRFRNSDDLKVTGVYQDFPSNSSLKMDFVAPFRIYEMENTWLEHWGNNGIQTYVKLKNGTDCPEFNSKIADYIKGKNEGSVVTLFLHPFKDLRLNSSFEKGKLSGGRIAIVRAFSAVALFILVIACINFMNLTTARSALRSREVGVRKVIGAHFYSLVRQFLGESMLITFFAMIVSVFLVVLLIPQFNELTSKKITLNFNEPVFWIGFVVILLVTGLLSGSYPAFLLSSFKPVHVLKGQSQTSLRGAGLRKVLVVIQFTLSVILIVSALVMYRQIIYMQEKDLGFNKENVIYFFEKEGIGKNFESFRNELNQQPYILGVGKSSALPFQVGSSTGDPVWTGKKEDDNVLFQTVQTDYDMIKIMGFHLLEGRYFSREYSTDTANFIINEEAARRMNYENPVGESLECWGMKGQIIGLVKDFHSQSLEAPIEPLIFMLSPENTWITFIRAEGSKTKEAVTFLEGVHKKYDPEYPFEYHFLDETYEEMYKGSMTIGTLAQLFTGIAIFIACLGLFGLASFTVERRSKELSIRKVFGASASRLTSMVINDFVLLVSISVILGSVTAWLIMNQYLDHFAFHIRIGAWVFIFTAVGILIIAIMTVGYQSIKAALANPAHILRNE